MPEPRILAHRKKMLIAVGAGVGVAAIALASAAGLGGLIVESIDAESAVVAEPFSDGVGVKWGEPQYDTATKSYVIKDFTVARDAVTELPVGTLSVTIAGTDGTALTEATALTTGASNSHLFTLVTPLPVDVVKKVSIILHDIDPNATYAITADSIGTEPGSIWATGSADTATLVTDPEVGAVLQLSGGAALRSFGASSVENPGIMHSTLNRTYPKVDNVYDARLPWANFFAGATNGQIDPVTSEELQPSSTGKITARVESGSTLWMDVDMAYGVTDDNLQVTRLTCELTATDTWSTVDLNDCYSMDDDLNLRWISTAAWTADANDQWSDPYTYAAGEHLSVTRPSPAVSAVAGYGFHVEGGGAAWVQGMELRGQTISFAN